MSPESCRGVLGKAEELGEGKGHARAHSPQFWRLLRDQAYCLWAKTSDQPEHCWKGGGGADTLLLRLQNQSSKQSQDKACQRQPRPSDYAVWQYIPGPSWSPAFPVGHAGKGKQTSATFFSDNCWTFPAANQKLWSFGRLESGKYSDLSEIESRLERNGFFSTGQM